VATITRRRFDPEFRAGAVLIGVRADGRKELVALADGYRESAESWADLLRDCARRGMRAPVFAAGDGALGFWSALAEVFRRPERRGAGFTRSPTCWGPCHLHRRQACRTSRRITRLHSRLGTHDPQGLTIAPSVPSAAATRSRRADRRTAGGSDRTPEGSWRVDQRVPASRIAASEDMQLKSYAMGFGAIQVLSVSIAEPFDDV
jgi:hypothetical protein